MSNRPTDKPLLLDLFCCAGGAARGYQRAGFYVVGVDIKHQPHYIGDEFYQADALEFLATHHQEFDAIHVSNSEAFLRPAVGTSGRCRNLFTFF